MDQAQPAFTSTLNKLYYNPKTGYISAQKLYEKAALVDSNIKLKDVKDWYKSQEEIQIHRRQASKFDDFKIASPNPDSWQADLTFTPSLKIFTAININSRIAVAYFIVSKSKDSMIKVLKRFRRDHKVSILTTDNGSEFTNHQVEAFFRTHSIKHFNNEAGDHHTMGKIERFNRTLKMRLMRMTAKITAKILKDVISNYNNTFHSTIKATPNDMKGKVDREALDHNRMLLGDVNLSFQRGDAVRYRLKKNTFQKESALWSKTVYTVIDIDGYRVQIKSENNHTLYKNPNDLSVVDIKEHVTSAAPIEHNQIWEVEKILEHYPQKNGKNKYLVKWLGYSEPTWEPQSNMRLINKNQMSTAEKKFFKKKTSIL